MPEPAWPSETAWAGDRSTIELLRVAAASGHDDLAARRSTPAVVGD
jgi:hypothetical protein